MVHHQAPLADCHTDILWVSDTKKITDKSIDTSTNSNTNSIEYETSKEENIKRKVAQAILQLGYMDDNNDMQDRDLH